MSCIFCNIASDPASADVVYDDDQAVAFRDINPQAPLHVLVIPRRHIETLNDLTAGDEALIGHLYLVARQVARDAGYAERGYRTVINCGRGAGQSVFHVHLHVLAGRALGWPPG